MKKVECNFVIKEENKDKINQVFADVQDRCKERLEDYDSVVWLVDQVDSRVCPITKKAMDGVKASYTAAEVFPNAYKYRASGTHFDIVFKAGKWHLTSVYRDYINNSNKNISVTLTDAAKQSIIENIELF